MCSVLFISTGVTGHNSPKRNFLILICSLIFLHFLPAQPVSTLLKTAEKEASLGHLQAAAESWERAGRLKNSDPELLYQAAEAYNQVRDYLRAADCYYAALKDKRFPLALLRYARALKQQGRVGEAATAFENFAQSYSGEFKAVMVSVAENEIAGCALAAHLKPDTLISIQALTDSVNTAEHEFAPIAFSDQLLYYSLATPAQAKLMRSKRKDLNWGPPQEAQSLPEAVSAKFRSGSFSADGSRFYYAQCETGCSAQSGGSATAAPCAIYCLKRTESGWMAPERLRAYINMEGSTTMFPQVAQGEGLEFLFFSSDRAGGFGGFDLYVCERPLDSEEFDFSFPQNLGRMVNTGADEVTPFYQADSKMLWFSSLGHPSLGGFDIFKTEKTEQGWLKPENAGRPINSPADDYYFVLKKSGEGGFLSSNRSQEALKSGTSDDELFELKW